MSVVLDLPRPFSSNKSRKIDWRELENHNKWRRLADGLITYHKQNRQNAIIGAYEAHITVSEDSRSDLDNCIKVLLDYAVRLKMVHDDGPDYLRKITVEFGVVPEGCRLVLTPFEPDAPFVTGTTRRRLVDYLWKHRDGATTGQLADILYAGKDRGDQRTIAVLIHHANKQLAPHLWRIRSTYGPGSIYRLERIEKAAPEEAA